MPAAQLRPRGSRMKWAILDLAIYAAFHELVGARSEPTPKCADAVRHASIRHLHPTWICAMFRLLRATSTSGGPAIVAVS